MNLNQITVPVADVDRSIEFYKKLGLKLIVHTHAGYARFVCPEGGATLSLHRTAQRADDGEGVWVYLECQDLDTKVASLVKDGIEFLEMPNDKTWLWHEAHLNDPDGNHLILYWGGEARVSPHWRLS